MTWPIPGGYHDPLDDLPEDELSDYQDDDLDLGQLLDDLDGTPVEEWEPPEPQPEGDDLD
jgi:hypothetical protein